MPPTLANSATILLGIDCGTESMRVLAVDSTGRLLGSARAPHPTAHPFPGAAEQQPSDWWSGLGNAIRMLADDGLPLDRVNAIGVTATSSTVVFATVDGEPLRPALLWMDVRATEEAARFEATSAPCLAVCPDGVSPEWGPPKAAWVADHEPDCFRRSRVICEGGDWLIHQMTGEWTINVPAAATAWFYDAPNQRWPVETYANSGCPGLESRLPGRVLGPGERAGVLLPEIAREFGLPAGIPVVEGGIDSVSAMLALGVIEQGTVALITGSSNVVLALSDEPIRARGVWGSYAGAALPRKELVVGLHGAGSAIAWLTRDILGDRDRMAELELRAASLPPGSDGLIALPDFQGNRTPYTEPRARGAYWGLSLGHGPAHLFRATLEGIAFATRQVLDAIDAAGVPVNQVRACGGATRSDFTMQMYADVLGRSIESSRTTDASALGAAISAAVGIGLFPGFEAAAPAMNGLGRTFAPDATTRHAYDAHYDLFRRTYPALMPLMREMADMKASQP